MTMRTLELIRLIDESIARDRARGVWIFVATETGRVYGQPPENVTMNAYRVTPENKRRALAEQRWPLASDSA